MDITILICTHNSAKRISETLQYLKRQRLTENISWEVLIVDYMSSDGTCSVAHDVWSSYAVPLRVIQEEKPGKTPALETGLKSAYGTSICIVDDDNWVHEDYVSVAHITMKDHPDIGVIGAYGEAHLEIEPPNWFEENKNIYAVGSQGSKQGYVHDLGRLWFWGAGSVIRKEAWLQAKKRGFVPILNPTRGSNSTHFSKGFTGGEDPELCFAIQLAGYKLWYEPNLKYTHFIPKSRLTPEFIMDAVSGVSAAGPILRIYLAEVTPSSFLGWIRKTIYTNWYLHLLYIIMNYFRSAISIYYNDARDKHMANMKLKYGFYSQVKAIYGLRRSFNNIYKSIRTLSK